MTQILLVDDDTDLSELLANQLKRMGFEVKCAASVAEAQAAVIEFPVDVLVTDFHLPDGDAEAVKGVVNAKVRVALTGHAGTLMPGFDAVLLKPVRAVQLAEAIRSLTNAMR